MNLSSNNLLPRLSGVDDSEWDQLPANDALRRFWRVRLSEREGYHRNYYSVTPEGDELEIDFNYPRQMARITVRPASENFREYFAVIKSGTILQERDVTARRPVDLTSRLWHSRKYFQYLPDETIIKVIGRNYDLPGSTIFGGDPFYSSIRYPFTIDRRSLLERFRDWIRRHLESRRLAEQKSRKWWRRILRRLPDELLDMSFGGLVVAIYMNQWIDLTMLAGLAGALGIITGGLDWVWRQRNPFLPKVILMLATSGVAVYYQVQNRIWGIFL